MTFVVCGGFNLFNSQKNNMDDWQGVSIESKLSADEKKWIEEKQKIVVGVSDSLLPLVRFTDGAGMGFLVDYMGIISDEINLDIVYKPILEKDIKDSLKKGLIDVAIIMPDSTSGSDIIYTMPLIPVKGKLCVPFGSDIMMKSDIVGKNIIVIKGQKTAAVTEGIGKKSQFTKVDSIFDGFELLKAGNYDGLLGNEMAINYYIKEENLQQEFAFIPNYMYEENLVVATLQGSELSNIMKIGVYYVDKNRAVPTLQSKWFGLSYDLQQSKPFGNIGILIFILCAGVAFIFYLFYFSNKSLYEELTERMELLRLSKNELQTTFDGVNYYMAEIDRNNCVTTINKAFEEYLNITRRNAASREISKLLGLNQELEVELILGIKNTFKLEKTQQLEISIGRKILEIRFFPIKDAREKVLKILMMAIDVTDDRSAKRQMIQDNKMIAIGQLATGVAHEIRNPLGIIRNYCFLLKTQADSNPQMKEKAIEIIEKSVERSGKIIDNLLNFSKKSKNKMEKINLCDEILGITSIQRKGLLEKKINMELTCNEDVMVDVLVESLELILINLISNAADSMLGGGTITIVCTENNGDMIIEVGDAGKGIPEDIKSDIFNPFFTTKQRNEGNGLGLYLVYNEIKKMNGYIDLVSEIDVGTTFIVGFPKNSEV